MLNLETELTRARYERISPIYDRIDEFMEWRFQPWREKIWQFAYGPRILEVGVGTGKNIELWPRENPGWICKPLSLGKRHRRCCTGIGIGWLWYRWRGDVL